MESEDLFWKNIKSLLRWKHSNSSHLIRSKWQSTYYSLEGPIQYATLWFLFFHLLLPASPVMLASLLSHELARWAPPQSFDTEMLIPHVQSWSIPSTLWGRCWHSTFSVRFFFDSLFKIVPPTISSLYFFHVLFFIMPNVI